MGRWVHLEGISSSATGIEVEVFPKQPESEASSPSAACSAVEALWVRSVLIYRGTSVVSELASNTAVLIY